MSSLDEKVSNLSVLMVGKFVAADVNAQDNDGDTPLHNAVMGRREGSQSDQVKLSCSQNSFSFFY